MSMAMFGISENKGYSLNGYIPSGWYDSAQ